MIVASAVLVVGVTACAGQSASPSVSLSASESPSPAAASIGPNATSTVVETPTSAPITSSGNVFSLLPAQQPADFVQSITCTGPIGDSDPVALVQLQAAVEGTGDVVLRDYADPSKPRTACSLGVGFYGQLIDARHLLISMYSFGGAVVDLPEVRYHWFQLPSGGQLLAVGPHLDQVLWETYDPEKTATDTIHLSTSSGDHIIATLPDNNMGRCGSAAEDSKAAAYTPSGSRFFVLNQPVAETTSLIVVEGEETVLSLIPAIDGWPEGGRPAMALWSPTSEALYYSQGGDIWKWRTGSQPEKFLADVEWLQPTISPDGAHMAYSVLRADSLHDTYLIDLAHEGAPKKIGGGARKFPVFVNSTQLWFKAEGSDHGCVGAEGERPLIYNIVDGSEARSIIFQVISVWPATSSNF